MPLLLLQKKNIKILTTRGGREERKEQRKQDKYEEKGEGKKEQPKQVIHEEQKAKNQHHKPHVHKEYRVGRSLQIS